MAVLERRRLDRDRRSTLWAWICVALIPVGFVVGLAAYAVVALITGVEMFPADESQAPTFTEELRAVTAGLLASVVAPAAAIILGVRAARAGRRAGTIAVLVAVALVVAVVGGQFLLNRFA